MSEIRVDQIKDRTGAYTTSVSKLPKISGAVTTGHMVVFSSATNTIVDGGIADDVTIIGTVTTGNLAVFGTTTNTIVDGGSVNSSLFGEIKMYAGAAAPTYWLICDGTSISRTTYSELFAIVGTAYGGGDGSTTFNVPDFRAKYARGVDGSFARGAVCVDNTANPSAGNPSGTTGNQSASHAHSGTTSGQSVPHTHTTASGIANFIGSYFAGGSNQTGSTTYGPKATGDGSVDHTHTVTTGNQSASHTHTVSIGTGWDTETRPNSVVVNYIIYTGVV